MNAGAYGHKPNGCDKSGLDNLHVIQIDYIKVKKMPRAAQTNPDYLG